MIKCKKCGKRLTGTTKIAEFQQVSVDGDAEFFEEIEIHECVGCGCHHKWLVTKIKVEEIK